MEKKIIESRFNKTNVKFVISDTTRNMYNFAIGNLQNYVTKEKVEDPFTDEQEISKLDIIGEEDEEQEVKNIKVKSKPQPEIPVKKIDKHFFTIDFDED